MFGVVYLPVPLAPRNLPEQPKHEYSSDARLIPLRQFFNRFECPAAEYAVDFLEVADEFALDWRLLLASVVCAVALRGRKNRPRHRR